MKKTALFFIALISLQQIVRIPAVPSSALARQRLDALARFEETPQGRAAAITFSTGKQLGKFVDKLYEKFPSLPTTPAFLDGFYSGIKNYVNFKPSVTTPTPVPIVDIAPSSSPVSSTEVSSELLSQLQMLTGECGMTALFINALLAALIASMQNGGMPCGMMPGGGMPGGTMPGGGMPGGTMPGGGMPGGTTPGGGNKPCDMGPGGTTMKPQTTTMSGGDTSGGTTTVAPTTTMSSGDTSGGAPTKPPTTTMPDDGTMTCTCTLVPSGGTSGGSMPGGGTSGGSMPGGSTPETPPSDGSGSCSDKLISGMLCSFGGYFKDTLGGWGLYGGKQMKLMPQQGLDSLRSDSTNMRDQLTDSLSQLGSAGVLPSGEGSPLSSFLSLIQNDQAPLTQLLLETAPLSI